VADEGREDPESGMVVVRLDDQGAKRELVGLIRGAMLSGLAD